MKLEMKLKDFILIYHGSVTHKFEMLRYLWLGVANIDRLELVEIKVTLKKVPAETIASN